MWLPLFHVCEGGGGCPCLFFLDLSIGGNGLTGGRSDYGALEFFQGGENMRFLVDGIIGMNDEGRDLLIGGHEETLTYCGYHGSNDILPGLLGRLGTGKYIPSLDTTAVCGEAFEWWADRVKMFEEFDRLKDECIDEFGNDDDNKYIIEAVDSLEPGYDNIEYCLERIKEIML
jgi:hypothetical protein